MQTSSARQAQGLVLAVWGGDSIDSAWVLPGFWGRRLAARTHAGGHERSSQSVTEFIV